MFGFIVLTSQNNFYRWGKRKKPAGISEKPSVLKLIKFNNSK